jgi:hypothetical protein
MAGLGRYTVIKASGSARGFNPAFVIQLGRIDDSAAAAQSLEGPIRMMTSTRSMDIPSGGVGSEIRFT